MDEIILIDKPPDLTSFGVVARIRRHLTQTTGKKTKVGHAGTLDPFATGLLILGVGKSTKKLTSFLKLDKTYLATLRLGYTSTTGDPEGEISIAPKNSAQNTKSFTSSKATKSEVQSETAAGCGCGVPTPVSRPGTKRSPEDLGKILCSVLATFVGEITQTPPIYSAIKIKGTPAYKLARKGQTPVIPPRKVTIHSIKIENYNYPNLTLKIHCSSGTYIRTLAQDIGEKLGTGAYLTALRRTKIGDYDIKNAKTLEQYLNP